MKNIINRALAAEKKLFTLLLAVAASIGTMFASTKIGDLYYNLDATNHTAEVTYKSYTNEGWGITTANIPASVTYNEITYSVTSIGEMAFYGCSSLTYVTIPNSVTSIGEYAFADCDGLTSVTIPNSVTSIGDGAFAGCSGLTSIDVASDNSNYCSVDGVLFNKDKTTLIQYPGGKQGSYTIPNSVTSIGSSAFYGCTGLTSVTIPNSVTSIGEYAFIYCSGLTSVTIPNSVTSIGDGAFIYCSGLTSVTIPNSVTSIGEYAFQVCSGLTSVTIESEAIVSNTNNLKNIFGNQVKEYIIGNSVTSIGDHAFAHCYGLISVTIPNSVTSIGAGAFDGCIKLVAIYATCGDLDRLKQLLDNDSRVKYEPIPYSLVIQAENGTFVTNYDSLTICDEPNVICTVTPKYGYHFTQWSDGSTDNPRTIVLTQDTTLSAICAPNQYSISVTCDENYGRIEGENGTFDYLTSHEYSALANTGYHFVKWSDGNTENPRTIVLTQDTTLSAVFAINRYLVQFFGFNNVLLDSQSIEHGTAAVAPEAPTVDHFDFVGWDKEFTNITSDLDVYAIYQKNTEDVENVGIDALPHKIMIDGQVLILRGDKTYTLQGQEVR